MNCTTAMTKEPKAKDPKWYRKAIPTACPVTPRHWIGSQVQEVDPDGTWIGTPSGPQRFRLGAIWGCSPSLALMAPSFVRLSVAQTKSYKIQASNAQPD